MKTNFSEEQIKDPDNKASENILRKCVHCGFCNATCPTYKLLGDECYSSKKLEALGFIAQRTLKEMNESDF